MGTLILLVVIGIALGLFLIKRSAARAASSGNTHDRAELADTPAARDAIAQWAQAHGYERAADTDAALLRYQKHVNARQGQPTFLDVRVADGQLVLESYLGMAHPFTRKAQPGQVPLGGSGLILALPRKLAKRDHNVLRDALGLPLIA